MPAPQGSNSSIVLRPHTETTECRDSNAARHCGEVVLALRLIQKVSLLYKTSHTNLNDCL